MLYTIKLFAILVIGGGAIAWLGDVIGARLGKRRSSLFGLRPRQTARLVAVAIGAALPIGGLLVATFASEHAHKAVFEMEQLVTDLGDLKQQVADYRDKVGEARKAATEAQEKAARSDELLVEKEAEVAGLTEVQGSLEGQVTGLEREVAHGERAVAQARDDLNQAGDDLSQAQKNLSATADDLTQARDDLNQAGDDLDVLLQEKGLTEGQLSRAEQRLASAVEANRQAQLEVDAKIQRLRALKNTLEDAQRQVADLRERDRLIAGKPAVFEPGDELMRVVMDASGTQDQIESELFELLHFAGAVVERRGVPTGANGRAVSVVAPSPRAVAPGEILPEAAIVRYVASELRTQGTDQWVVIVRSFRRLFAEDEAQLQVQLKATPNKLVFKKGEVLAAIRVDAQTETPQIFQAIYLVITHREKSPVRARAIARGMLPDPNTGNYGEVNLNEIFAAAAEVQKRQGIVPVRVVAQSDIYTAGPLSIDLQVGEGSP